MTPEEQQKHNDRLFKRANYLCDRVERENHGDLRAAMTALATMIKPHNPNHLCAEVDHDNHGDLRLAMKALAFMVAKMEAPKTRDSDDTRTKDMD